MERGPDRCDLHHSGMRFPQGDGRIANESQGAEVSDPLHHAGVISRYTFCLLQMGSRANQYFWRMAWRARGQSSGGRMRAVAGNSGPVIVPRIVLGAMRTCGLLRMRLDFPESLRVIT